MLSIFTRSILTTGVKPTSTILSTGLNTIREASTKTNKTAKLKGQLKAKQKKRRARVSKQ